MYTIFFVLLDAFKDILCSSCLVSTHLHIKSASPWLKTKNWCSVALFVLCWLLAFPVLFICKFCQYHLLSVECTFSTANCGRVCNSWCPCNQLWISCWIDLILHDALEVLSKVHLNQSCHRVLFSCILLDCKLHTGSFVHKNRIWILAELISGL